MTLFLRAGFSFTLLLLTVTPGIGIAKDKEKDPDEVGNRYVGKGVNFYSLEKEIALGKGLAQEVECQAALINSPGSSSSFRTRKQSAKFVRPPRPKSARVTITACQTIGWRLWLLWVPTGVKFLETAPYLIVVFRIDFGIAQAAEGVMKTKHYYVQQSVGIATGFFLAALHMSGLATLTHTPSLMGFLSTILGRPKNERPFVLIPVGLPAADATVPAIGKQSLSEVMEIK